MIPTNDIVAIMSAKLANFIPLAENLGKSRFLVYESEVHAPEEDQTAQEKEDAEMEAIADSFRCEIKNSGNQFSLYFYMNERNPGGFLEIVDAGMPPPLVGGDNGIAHNPDGSTYKSNAPIAAYGNPIPGYAKEGTGVINEIRTMLESLFHDYFIEVFNESKPEIAKIAKRYVAERIHAAIGG